MWIALGIIVAVIVGLFAFASTRPDTFRYVRSATIKAPAATVFSHVNDFRRWEAWSPWAGLDPQMKTTYSGPETGVGARYDWDSKSGKVGAGGMEISEVDAPNRIEIELRFLRPFKAENHATFTFTEQGGATTVEWIMTGRNILMGKVFGLFMDMEKMIGKDFEKGLAALARAAEA
ncbi:MAG: SRPBCC family protein [Myxococcales bacterium]|nr:SRPBCC family protein [Myxococcales bacterium]MCB9547200.1 SRPBCC family protein [Myxococcales bacterium]